MAIIGVAWSIVAMAVLIPIAFMGVIIWFDEYKK